MADVDDLALTNDDHMEQLDAMENGQDGDTVEGEGPGTGGASVEDPVRV